MPDSNGVYSKGEIAYLFDKKVGTVSNWMSTGKLPRQPNKSDVAHFAAQYGTGTTRGSGRKTYHVPDLTPDQYELLQVLCQENGMSAVDPSVVQAERNAALKEQAGRNLQSAGVDIGDLRESLGVNVD